MDIICLPGTVDISDKSNHNNVSMYTQKTVRIKNIISFCETVQQSITEASRQTLATTPQDGLSQLPHKKHLATIRNQAQHISHVLERKDAHAGHLPIRSRRAYQWLMFLSERENFHHHLNAVRTLYQKAHRIRTSDQFDKRALWITLFNIGPLYRVKPDQDALMITLHESFLIAPQDVFSAVLDMVFRSNEKEARATIRNFSSSPSFAKIREKLAYVGIPPLAGVQGRDKNLHHAFRRVNKRYFQSALSCPHLVWSERLTHRKFGHYQYETDTVLISRSLDDPHISKALLDFVMYHELLHKDMGYTEKNGRRYSHTPAFRKRERAFQNYQEVKSALENLSQTLA